ncbi:MAG: hypothetical protein ACKVWR_13715 [Acidimicrobiales bacterium]
MSTAPEQNAFRALGPDRWFLDQLERYFASGLSDDSAKAEAVEQALSSLEAATQRFEEDRVAQGRLVALLLTTRRARRVITASCFRSLPHPGVLLGIGLRNCEPGDVVELRLVRHARPDVVRRDTWPFSLQAAEALSRPEP